MPSSVDGGTGVGNGTPGGGRGEPKTKLKIGEVELIIEVDGKHEPDVTIELLKLLAAQSA
jgi:hypothetical protein